MIAMVEELQRQPLLREVFDECDAGWTAVREASRVVKERPELEADMAAAARTLTVRQIERKARELRGEPELVVRRLELPPLTNAHFDQAIARVHVAMPTASEAEALEVIVQSFLRGGAAVGEARAASSRLVLHCAVPAASAPSVGAPATGEAATAPGTTTKAQAALDAACASVSVTVQGREERVEVPPAVFEEALCDAAIHDVRDELPSRVTRTVRPSVARLVNDRDHGRCRAPGCDSLGYLHQHHVGGRRVVGHDPSFMLTACSSHHRMLHEGTLRLSVVPGGFLFSLLDGTPPVFVPYEPGAVAAVVAPRSGPVLAPALSQAEEDAVGALVVMELKRRDALEAVRLAAQTLRGRGVAALAAGELVFEALRALPSPHGRLRDG